MKPIRYADLRNILKTMRVGLGNDDNLPLKITVLENGIDTVAEDIIITFEGFITHLREVRFLKFCGGDYTSIRAEMQDAEGRTRNFTYLITQIGDGDGEAITKLRNIL